MRRSQKAKLNFKLLLLLFFFALNGYSQKLFLVAGQSNAVGLGDFRLSIHCAPQSAYEYKDLTNSFLPLADPVGETGYGFDVADTGSAWPAFAKRYHELTLQKVYLVPAAKSGSTLNPNHYDYLRWDSLGNLWLSAIEKTKKALQQGQLALSGVIWAQGEADASFINSGSFSAGNYKIELKKLISRLRNQFGLALPFYVIQTGYAEGENAYGYEAVQRIQKEISNEVPYTFLVYSFAKYFSEFNLMKDYIHYNQRGYNVVGKIVAETIYEIDLVKKYTPPTYSNTVFPNPSTSTFNVQFVNVALEEKTSIYISDLLGNIVKEFTVELDQQPIETFPIDLNDLPIGLYFLKHRQTIFRIKVMQ